MKPEAVQNLRHALDEIMNMNEEELFADINNPENKYYFSELGEAEKMWCDGSRFD